MRLRFSEALDERIELAFAREVGQRVLERVERARGVRDRPRAVERGLEHGLARELADVLAEVADREAALDGDLAVVGLLLARDQPEDRGLAGAVRADQPDLLAAVNGRGCLEEQDLVAMPLRDGVDADHVWRSTSRIAYSPGGRLTSQRAARSAPAVKFSRECARCESSTRSPGPAKYTVCSPTLSPSRSA